jgi:5-oxopent-3-ene-1,2,5-tricarboxylate decarboxylase/2-hydroxyhepta-2,4-diene-1,7-dioate isomerase
MNTPAASFQASPGAMPPRRGTVYGVALNDPADIAALGEAVHQAPYKAAPRAPVLYIKPRNTWARSGDAITVPAGIEALRMGAALGVVIGRIACHVDVANALDHVAGYCVVNEVAVPHASWYRPSVPCLARDGFCVIGDDLIPASAVSDQDEASFRVDIDRELVQQSSTSGRIRGVAQLIAELSEFMTLLPGDIVLTGLTHQPPLARIGQTVSITFDGIGRIENTLVVEEVA